jgi:hypothetical protein
MKIMKFMKTITGLLFFVSLMNVVVISCTLKHCRIMEPNSMNNDELMVHGFNYSDFEQILHCVFKKKRKAQAIVSSEIKKATF